MGGGIIQLVSYGAQDLHISGNPQITFFKAVYKRHTMFAIENIPQFGIGESKWGNKITYTVSRKADLLSSSFLEFYVEFLDSSENKLTPGQLRREVNLKSTITSLAKSLGYSFIDYIEVEINGTKIDRHTGHWMALKSELGKNFTQRIQDLFINNGFYEAPHISDYAIMIVIPLQFWFNENPGLAFPLVALQHHDFKIEVKLNPLSKIVLTPSGTRGSVTPTINHNAVSNINLIEMNLNCDYIYLDEYERRLFANNKHEYLIEQLQILPGEYCSSSTTNTLIPLTFNHPVKEIVWTIHDKSDESKLGSLWSGQKNRVKYAKIQLNGVDRFPEKPGIYFQTIQPINHHSGLNLHTFLTEMKYFYVSDFQDYTDDVTNYNTMFPNAALDPFIYSFALKADKYQPSGTCNFSRLDNAVLSFTVNANKPSAISSSGLDIRIYGVNYNVLRIIGGMGGLTYSN